MLVGGPRVGVRSEVEGYLWYTVGCGGRVVVGRGGVVVWSEGIVVGSGVPTSCRDLQILNVPVKCGIGQ